MRVLVVGIALLLWAVPALAEQKSPEGFGPIKFGMTKEEAVHALGDEGEWKTDDTLTYIIAIPGLDPEAFVVEQYFKEGRASEVILSNQETYISLSYCMTKALDFVGRIKTVYQISPMVHDNILEKYPSDVSNIYYFSFDNGSRIEVVMTANEEIERCTITIYYSTPTTEFIPF